MNIFDKIDEVEKDAEGKTILCLDLYNYIELKRELGYGDLDPEIDAYHGYKILVVEDAENLIKLR
jgi:hypothetical protein